MSYEIAIGTTKPLKFRTAQHLLSWCQDELDFWKWVQDVNPQQLANLTGSIHATISSLNSVISSPDNVGYQNGLEGQIVNLQNAIESNQYCNSKSAVAEFIRGGRRISDQQLRWID